MQAYKQEFIELGSGASQNLSKRRKILILLGVVTIGENENFS